MANKQLDLPTDKVYLKGLRKFPAVKKCNTDSECEAAERQYKQHLRKKKERLGKANDDLRDYYGTRHP